MYQFTTTERNNEKASEYEAKAREVYIWHLKHEKKKDYCKT